MRFAERPVIVYQKSIFDDLSTANNRESSISGNGLGILAKPTSTATTWLGKRVRQQKKVYF